MKRGKKKVDGGNVVVHLDHDMWEGLEEVRRQMSQLKRDRISLGAIVRMYLEKGLTADKALPRPQLEKV